MTCFVMPEPDNRKPSSSSSWTKIPHMQYFSFSVRLGAVWFAWGWLLRLFDVNLCPLTMTWISILALTYYPVCFFAMMRLKIRIIFILFYSMFLSGWHYNVFPESRSRRCLACIHELYYRILQWTLINTACSLWVQDQHTTAARYNL